MRQISKYCVFLAGSVLTKIELVAFRIGRTVVKDEIGILTNAIYTGNDQQRVLAMAVQIPKLHGTVVIHGHHAGGDASKDIFLIHHGMGQVMAEQLVPKAESLCVTDADGSVQPQLCFGIKGLLMRFRAFVLKIIIEHPHVCEGARFGDFTFIDPVLIDGKGNLVTVPIFQQQTIVGDGPDDAGVEIKLIFQKLHDFVLADGTRLIQDWISPFFCAFTI